MDKSEMAKNEITKSDTPEKDWKRMSFKGNKVWVATTQDGLFLETDNKVKIKYNLKQDYEYLIKKESLEPLEKAIPAGKKKKGSSKSSKKGNILPKLPKNCIQIYTDGASSGNPGPAGIGALLIYNENRKEISQSIGTATNNVAELTAIKIAISHLKRNDLPVRIFSDSSYAIGALTKTWKPGTDKNPPNKNQPNKELISEIRTQIQAFPDLKFIKVKGHAGIKENEVADFLATKSIKKGSIKKAP
jgi:ribonuclease HI